MSSYFGSSEEAMEIVKAIGLRDKRIRELEEQVKKMEQDKRQNVAGHIVEPPNRDEWVNWGKNATGMEGETNE